VAKRPGGGDVKQLIDAMDERGAWNKIGTIGRADRLVFTYAAKDMVVRIGRGPPRKSRSVIASTRRASMAGCASMSRVTRGR
jgi:hypothetical protein